MPHCLTATAMWCDSIFRDCLQCLQDASAGPAEPAESSQAQKGVAGMGANLVSTVRSFLPFVSKSGDAQPQPAAGKKPVKVSEIILGS